MQIAWQPSASIEHLKKRAQLVQKLRAFFAEREVLEVETPLMCHTSVTDPAIESVPALFRDLSKKDDESVRYYLQTSPEYAMKRLLAAGSGAIYQLSKAFRQGEVGRYHNPEFTMLEWYRVDFDHYALMDEMDALLQTLLPVEKAERISYQVLFETHCDINPHIASVSELEACAKRFNVNLAVTHLPKEEWLNVLMAHVIEPNLGKTRPCFIYDFPLELSALARIMKKDHTGQSHDYAARFEVYYKGVELANGFYELNNADEQRHRFLNNNRVREELGLQVMPLDEYFLSALSFGLPDCAGVALGFDRLVMLALGVEHIKEVISFDFTRA